MTATLFFQKEQGMTKTRKANVLVTCWFLILFLSLSLSHVHAISLSKEEKEYLRTKETIVFVSQTRYPPFEFVDKDGQLEGMMLDIVRWLAVEIGFRPMFTHMTFQQAQEAVLFGTADILTSLFYSEKRNERFEFTGTLFDVPASVFVKPERTDIKDLRDLTGKRIAIQKGDYAKDFLISKGMRFETLDTKDFGEATDLVIAGKADAVIGDKQIVLHYIYSNRLTDRIKEVGEPLYTGKNCMASSKNNAILIRILEKGINEARKSGVLDKVSKKWLGTLYGPRETLLDRYLGVFFAIAGGILLLSLWVWIWNARLRTLVRKKTELITSREEALKESEKRLNLVLEGSQQGFWDWNVETGEVLRNERWAEILGYTLDEIESTNKQWTDLIHPDDRAMAWQSTRDHLEGRTPVYEIEYRMLTKEGQYKWILDRGKVVEYDPNGRPVRMSGTHTDSTERKQAEEALKESEERFRNLMEHMPVAVQGYRADATVVYWNKASERTYGYSAEEAIGNNLGDMVIPPDLKPLFRESLAIGKGVQKSGEFIPAGEIMLLHKDGHLFPVYSIHTAAVLEGKEPLFFCLDVDMTERKHLESQLFQLHKMEAIGTLAGGIAHDFNNLLMGIQGNASLMLLTMDSSNPYYERLKSIEQYVQSGAELTKQLLGFARAGMYEVKPTDINDLIEKNSEMFGRTKKEIVIQRRLEKGAWTVEVDRGQIDQVFLNLYVNAWQAMTGGGYLYIETQNVVLNEIYVKPYGITPGRYVKVSVTDTGTGMDEKVRQRVFEPFFTTKDVGRGTGLGLASAYGIIRNHGGFINVYSEKGHGTTFTLYLPASEKPVESGTPEIPDVLKGTETILIVDDEKDVLNITKESLEALGYRTLIATSGQDAINIYREKKADIHLVILDMIMPGMGGGETFDALKTLNPDVIVILSSGYSIDGEARQIMDQGCRGFIQKPFQIHQLSQKIREVL
jgi:PAS domain S-box-containing protein